MSESDVLTTAPAARRKHGDVEDGVYRTSLHGASLHDKGLRLRLADAVLGRSAAEAAALDGFLALDDHRGALRVWVGENGLRRTGDEIFAMLARDVAAIDAMLGDQLDAILHQPEFQQLEAGWRGVDYLVGETQSDENVRIRIFNASWPEVVRDFSRAPDFDQSALFEKVYNEEYGMPGGVPYGLILCDYAVRHRRSDGAPATLDDVGALNGLAQVAAAAFSPCIVGAAPELFGVSNFADLSYMQRIDEAFRLSEYARWRNLRERDDSRFLGVALPRVLLRDRYRIDSAREDGFVYEEGGGDLRSWLWGNAAYAFGAVVIRTFRETGWFVDIKGARLGSEERDPAGALPAPGFSTGEGSAYRRPLEVELTDRKQKALEELGFISLSPCAFTKSITLLGVHSLHVSAEEATGAERANATLSAMLQYVLCVSRFVHYVKVMARDRIGAFTTAAALERYLGEWLRGYTTGNKDASAEIKARYPLSEASIRVTDEVGRPGTMACVVHLQPHFVFDHMATGFQLRTELQPTMN